MSKTNGKRNRSAGNGWERELANEFRKLGFPHVITSRKGSRLRDSQKVDLMNEDEDAYGRLPYNVQAKNVKGHLKYAKVIGELPNNPGIINVIMHKQTVKTNERFVCSGKYAILNLDDFLNMIKKIKTLEGHKTIKNEPEPDRG